MRILAALAILLSVAIGVPVQAGAQEASTALGDVPVTWTVTVPGAAWRVDRTQPIEIRTSAGPAQRTGVRLQSAAFIEATTSTLIPGGWVLCEDMRRRCDGAPIVLEANTSRSLWLHPPDRVTFNGTYDASVVIVSTEEPAGRTLSFKLYGKMAGRQFLGFVIILIGVAGAALVTIWVPNQANRTQLLLPAARLRERAARLRSEIGTLVRKPARDSHVEALIKGLDAAIISLSPKALEADGLVPTAWAMSISGTPNDGYGAHLGAYTSWLNAVGIVVAEGMVKAEAIRSRHAERGKTAKEAAVAAENLATALTSDPTASPADQTAAATARDSAQADLVAQEEIVAAARKAIDDLADLVVPPPPAPVSSLEEIVTSIETIVAALDLKAAGPAALAAAAAAPRAARIRPPGSSELLIGLRQFQLAGWLAFAFLSVLVGTFVLIVQPNSFGTVQDFFWCFLWGFGLPVGAGQFATLTNVRETLRIPTPG